MRLRLALLLAIIAATTLSASAWAQLPDPPTEAQARALVQQLRVSAAAHTTPEARQRIVDYLDTIHGESRARLNHHAGVLLAIRGCPQESLWCLCGAALTDFEQPDTLNNIGFALTMLDEMADAERILLYATHFRPEFSPAWVNLARVYLDTGEDDYALECLDRADEVEPGTVAAEEGRARWAMQRGDGAAAAESLVDLSNLDPANPRIPDLIDFVPEGDLVAALHARTDAVPMPAHLVELEDIVDEYEEFVLDELNRGYWGAANRSAAATACATPRQSVTLTQEVFDQLPPDMQAIIRANGGAPGEPTGVLAPTESRTHYLRLGMRLQRYEERYLQRMRDIYTTGPIKWLYDEERDRQRDYHEQLVEALRAGADFGGAIDRWIAQCLGSLNSSHPAWLAAMDEAREEANAVTRRHWMSVAGLIAMVPEAHREAEITYLLKVATLSNLRHTGEVSKWYTLGMRAVVHDRARTEAVAEALHTAAADREWQAYCDRLGWEREWEWELEDGEGFELDIDEWRGIDLGVFSVKVVDDSVSIGGGEVIVGDASFDWGEMELQLGIGLGAATPSVVPGVAIGGSAKVLGVIRLGGDIGAGLGVREQVQGTLGAPGGGYDINFVDHYTWLVAAGEP
jgi:tetratricopeptide (TPR) repeat protein